METSILTIRDKGEDQEALAIVRSVNGYVALALSLEHEGDVEVAFTPAECEDLIARLQQAAQDAQAEAMMTAQQLTARNPPELQTAGRG